MGVNGTVGINSGYGIISAEFLPQGQLTGVAWEGCDGHVL